MQMTTSFARTSFHSRENQEWLSHYGGCACKEPLFTRFFSLRVSFFSFSFVFQRASNSKSRPARRGGGKTWSRVASIFRLFSLEMRTRMKASENSRVFDSWNEFLIFAIPFPLHPETFFIPLKIARTRKSIVVGWRRFPVNIDVVKRRPYRLTRILNDTH